MLLAVYVVLAPAQQIFPPEAVPSNFSADAAFAEQVRVHLLPSTQPATGRYATGKQVLDRLTEDRLTEQLPSGRKKFSWDLRIVKGIGNAFSSPDGTIFIDEDLAGLLGSRAGLWAAVLSHEMAHVIRRDWARRYLFQKSLEESSATPITVGPGASVKPWADASGSSGWEASAFARPLAVFRQNQELEADAEGLMIMAKAGFHPDYMPALYHLLQVEPLHRDAELRGFSNPLWDERCEKLHTHVVAARKEFSRLWPAPYDSPGGNPPVVVYAGAPSVHHISNGEREVQVPVHCDNMYGGAGVTLRLTAARSGFVRELHLDTGCTSDNTVLKFTLASSEMSQAPLQGLIIVLDNGGDLVTRSVWPKPIR